MDQYITKLKYEKGIKGDEELNLKGRGRSNSMGDGDR